MSTALIFWDVDTQVDFIMKHGKLAVPGAEEIIPRLRELTAWAHRSAIPIVATADDHDVGHAEISDHPDWRTTFPPHCMRGTAGQKKIDATTLRDPLILQPVPLERDEVVAAVRAHRGDFLLNKPGTDVFRWNPNAATVLDTLAPDRVVVYGVATDFCTRAAVTGLARHRPQMEMVIVVDAIRGIDATASEALIARVARRRIPVAADHRTDAMSVSGRFWIPGPVEVDPDVSRAMLQPMIAHRGDAARALVSRLQPGLRAIFGTERTVMLATASATAMMEAGIRSGVADHVLCIVSGTFGERFAATAERCGKQVTRLHVHRGDVLEPALLDRMLDGPPVDAVTMVHSETSTGALAPVADIIGRFRASGDIITIVDVVSSAAGIPVETDRWQADFIFTGSQKAIGIPPGLAFAVASERFIERARSLDDRGFYLDVVDLLRAAEESRFPQTPALPVVYALEAQLRRIEAEGLPARFARHHQMRERIEAWVSSHGRCDMLAAPGRRSDTVTALALRPDLAATSVVAALARDGWQVAAGLEGDEDRLIRIGHMGEGTPAQLDLLLSAIEPLL